MQTSCDVEKRASWRAAWMGALATMILTSAVAVSSARADGAISEAGNAGGLDPALEWHSFQGSASDDYGKAVGVDRDGNACVAGYGMASWASPVRPHAGGADALVAKLASDGTLLWNTFLGSALADAATCVAVDSSGNVYVGGWCNTTWGSPVRGFTAGGNDGFVAKLSGDGSLMWNTFLGSAVSDACNGITVDESGDVYVIGVSAGTWGSPARGHSGSSDTFVAKLATNGSLIWNTFLGGVSSDYGYGVAIDRGDEAVVTGTSLLGWGTPIRPYSSGWDAFVVRLAANGTLLWSTFLGTASGDSGRGITLDGSGNAYVAGESDQSWGSPVRGHTGSTDAFVAKLGAGGALTWNTFLGCADLDQVHGICLDSSGYPWVAGLSRGSWGSPAIPYSGDIDGFVAKLQGDGSLVWNTFVGSGGGDQGLGIAAGGDGAVYVGGQSNASWGSPIRTYSGGNDSFVAKILGCSGAPAIETQPADQSIASGMSAMLTVGATGGSPFSYQWYVGASGDVSNPISGANDPSYVTPPLYASTGYWVRVGNACGSVDSDTATITIPGSGPTITRIKSRKSKPGSKATILGTGFSSSPGSNTVYFGKKKAAVKSATTTSLKVTIPSGLRKGSVLVYAMTAGNKSNVYAFTIK